MRRIVLWALAGILLFGGGLVAWFYLSSGSGEPTTDLTTPTIPGDPVTTVGGTADPTGTTLATAGGTSFVIDPANSIASFEIDEVLRGEPKHVIGTTSELVGQVVVDPADLSTAQVSQIVINARTFETDSGNRDRAIRGPVILNSADDRFELITFDPVSVDGLEGGAATGDTFDFTVTGDLTIKGTSQPVTFDVSATMVSDQSIEGIAETTVNRSDFGLGIPQAPGVADVSEEVLIRLEFVAVAA